MSPLILLLFSVPIILVLYSQKKHRPLPPGPPGLPFIGNMHQFDSQYPHTYLHRLSKQYGPLMSMKLGFRQVLVISSADLVREIMKSHDIVFSGRPSLVTLKKLSYNGLDIAFSSYTGLWREMRKITTLHLFSPKQIQCFQPVREDEVSRMIEKISMDASLSRVTNLSDMMTLLTSNTILRVAFGKRMGDEGFENKRFNTLFHDVQDVLGGFFVEDYLPLLGWVDKITGVGRKLDKIFREFDCFYQELIEEHLDANRPKSMEGDILDLLLGLQRDGLGTVNFTMDHVKALMMNIILGGTDTISAVTIWAMTALMKNPVIMKKVQAEIRQLGKRDFIHEDEIATLPYLRAVIKETFRLYPPAPLLVPRETLQECTINGYEIQPKTLVHINAWAIARDPEYWKSPEEFLPERFLENDVDVKGRDPILIPFGTGRRGCPGLSLGMVTMELVLANLLNAFDWELPPGVKEDDIDFDVVPGMTMYKKVPLCVVAKSG